MFRRLFLWSPLVLGLSCAHVPTVSPKSVSAAPAATPAMESPRPDSGLPGLKFVVVPPEANISINDVSRGRVADLAATGGFLPLRPAVYQVSLTLAGYQTWRAEVAVTQTPELLKVSLTKSR